MPLRPRVRTLAIGGVLVGLALVGAACSGDGGDEEAFCARIGDNRELLLGVSVDPASTAAALEVYDQVVDDAPDAIADEAETIRGLLRELQELDFTDDAAFGEAFEKLFDLEVRRDAERFTAYVEERCAVDLRTSPSTAPTTTAPREPTSPTAPTTAAP